MIPYRISGIVWVLSRNTWWDSLNVWKSVVLYIYIYIYVNIQKLDVTLNESSHRFSDIRCVVSHVCRVSREFNGVYITQRVDRKIVESGDPIYKDKGSHESFHVNSMESSSLKRADGKIVQSGDPIFEVWYPPWVDRDAHFGSCLRPQSSHPHVMWVDRDPHYGYRLILRPDFSY